MQFWIELSSSLKLVYCQQNRKGTHIIVKLIHSALLLNSLIIYAVHLYRIPVKNTFRSKHDDIVKRLTSV